jgi:branched-chain amino acid aminotransferase
MKKESVDRNLDYVISTDEQGYITESATENIILIDQHGTLIHPLLDHILKGTTMIRAFELAQQHGIATAVKPVSIDELHLAKEIMITGTSLNILPVIKFENHKIGQGHPGPIPKKLNALMLDDIKNGTKGTFF